MKIVYLGLGSNLGNREEALQTAINRLHCEALKITRISSVYETSPQDFTAQPWFLNLVLEAESELLPMRLLQRTMSVEKEMGRKRVIAKGPREIDIDILLHGRAVVSTPQLTIPHAGLAQRRFVLEPLAELAPDLRHPVLRQRMRELLAATTQQAVKRIEWRPRIQAL